MATTIRPITDQDKEWIIQALTRRWGSHLVVSRGKPHDASQMPGFIAYYNGEPVGIATYHIDGLDCELITLDSWLEKSGVGSQLVEAVKGKAIMVGCHRLWLITTNDNLEALSFYQKRGFHLVAVHPNALAESRKLKPSIPTVGMNGIPLRDEIELQILLV